MPLVMRFIRHLMRSYWFLRRPLTMGALGVVLDSEERVLLVRLTYRPGWSLPGGGVQRGESLVGAVTRELWEEVGVRAQICPANLFGVYYNTNDFKHDHCAVFLVRDWEHAAPDRRCFEIAEQRFFRRDELPEDTSPGTRARLQEIFQQKDPEEMW